MILDRRAHLLGLTVLVAPGVSSVATLRVEVHEDGVASLQMRTVMNKPAPHEHVVGQLGTIPGLPAFE